VKSSPTFLTADEVAELVRNEKGPNEFVVVDVRRNDHAVGYLCPFILLVRFAELE